MKVLIDMNLSTQWVELLVAHGHEASHWAAVGAPEAGDDELLEWAVTEGAAILTNDLDFGIELVTRGRSKPSVIQLRSDDLRPATLGGAVLAAIEKCTEEVELGALITVDAKRSRIRILTLREDAE
jgi:predicted nuclease of predicted toxin-antitoxin system